MSGAPSSVLAPIVAMRGAPSSVLASSSQETLVAFLLLVAMPGAPSSPFAPSRDARSL